MWRHCAKCNHCGARTSWQGEREVVREEMMGHLRQAHNLPAAREVEDFQMPAERQCDYCLEPFLDMCTKCSGDFCQLHAGDIDGLCGGCI